MPLVSENISSYVKKLKELSLFNHSAIIDSLNLVELLQAKLNQFAMQMLFDEYEIVSWINFIDMFDFIDLCKDINNLEQVFEKILLNIWFIGGATKCVTNDD
jgi:hypothetical protein